MQTQVSGTSGMQVQVARVYTVPVYTASRKQTGHTQVGALVHARAATSDNLMHARQHPRGLHTVATHAQKGLHGLYPQRKARPPAPSSRPATPLPLLDTAGSAAASRVCTNPGQQHTHNASGKIIAPGGNASNPNSTTTVRLLLRATHAI